MNIGKRLRKIRLAKGWSQGDVEKATGLKRCYVSRVEGGFTIPSLQTFIVLAKGFQIPLHDFLYQLTAPRFNSTHEDGLEIGNEPTGAVEPAEPESEQALQTVLQMAEETPKVLETANSGNGELTHS